MRRNYAALLLVTASVASCARSEMEGPVYGEGLSILARNGDDSLDSKSYFGPGGQILYWSAYDDLGVYDYTSPLSSSTSKVCGAKCLLISRNGSSACFSDEGVVQKSDFLASKPVSLSFIPATARVGLRDRHRRRETTRLAQTTICSMRQISPRYSTRRDPC